MTDHHHEEDTAAMQPTTIDVTGPANVGDPTQHLPRVRRPAAPSLAFPAPADTETQAQVINRILDEQERLNQQHANRVERLFRRRRAPRTPLTVRDMAAVKLARAERMEQHRDRHQRHMDALEAIRAYLGIMCLVAVFVLIVVMGFLGFGIIAGYFTWAPVH